MFLNSYFLAELGIAQKLFPLLTIHNSRKQYGYSDGESIIEFIIEDLEYRNKDKVVNDAMIELEVQKASDKSDITGFVEILKKLYQTADVASGKIMRATQLLQLDY